MAWLESWSNDPKYDRSITSEVKRDKQYPNFF